jgi:hypothetical protein
MCLDGVPSLRDVTKQTIIISICIINIIIIIIIILG